MTTVLVQRCDLCQNEKFHYVSHTEIKDIVTAKGSFDFDIRLAICTQCGLVARYPMPDSNKLKEYYVSTLNHTGFRDQIQRQNEVQPRLKSILKHISTGFVLEVGAGDGFFLTLLKDHGFDTVGIEPGTLATNSIINKEITIFHGIYEDYPLGTQKFDAVCHYYVMEHVYSPRKMLEFCNQMLQSNGYLFLEIPEISQYRNELAPYDLLSEHYEHLHHFTENTVSLLLNSCGFELVEIVPDKTYPFGIHIVAQKFTEIGTVQSLNFSGYTTANQIVESHRNYYSTFVETVKNTVIDRINKCEGNIVIFGTGDFARRMLKFEGFPSDRISYFVDNNDQRWGDSMCGIPIQSPQTINNNVQLIIIAARAYSEITKQMIEMGIDEALIYPLAVF